MSLFEIASQGSGHQVSDSAEPLRRINASVPGHDQAEWLAGVLGWLQTVEASLSSHLSRTSDRGPERHVSSTHTRGLLAFL